MSETNLSNWGRWGPEDQIGVLNLLTPEVILRAFKLVKKGKVYSLAVPLEKDGPQMPTFHKTWRVSHVARRQNPDLHIIDDVIMMETHSGTHIDAIGHVWAEGRFYNNFSDEYASSQGVARTGIENVRYIVGRGVMLDIAAYRGVDHLGPRRGSDQGRPGRRGLGPGHNPGAWRYCPSPNRLVQAFLPRLRSLADRVSRPRRVDAPLAEAA